MLIIVFNKAYYHGILFVFFYVLFPQCEKKLQLLKNIHIHTTKQVAHAICWWNTVFSYFYVYVNTKSNDNKVKLERELELEKILLSQISPKMS